MKLLLRNKWEIKNELYDIKSSSLLDSILSARGMISDDDKKWMLLPDLNMFNDPFLFKDMQKACDAIIYAIRNKHKIVIYGDYDADGIASTSILYLFLRYAGATVTFIIPNRISEGYGLTDSGVRKLIDAGTKLVITVDCGISSINEIQELIDNDMQVVLTDHHECKKNVPKATAIINPKMCDCDYPFKELAGAGVVLKLIQALCVCLNLGDLWKSYIDIAAIGTVADVVPLADENRMIVYHGLKEMNRFTNIGMRNLFERIDMTKKEITAAVISYGIAPRLNAAGRMGDCKRSVRLLTSSDNIECSELAQELISDNIKRQEIETEIFNIAKEQITAGCDFTSNEIIIVYKMGWHQGVVGIVASKLAELFNRPVIVFGGDNGFYRGSARGNNTISILDAIEYAKEYVYRFGGHKKAAGLVVREDMMKEFLNKMRDFSLKQMPRNWEDKKISIDFEIPHNQITLQNAKDIARLAPFGEGNLQPLFVSRNFIVNQIRFLSSGKHMKLSLAKPVSVNMTAADHINERIDAIAFGFSEKNTIISIGDTIDIVYFMNINEWNGITSVQIVVKDIRKSTETGKKMYNRMEERYQKTPADFKSILQESRLQNDEIIPQKEDFAAVYKYIKSNYPHDTVLCDLDVLAPIISDNYRVSINVFKLARIFDIFNESEIMNVINYGHFRIKFNIADNIENNDSKDNKENKDYKTNISLSKSKTYANVCMENPTL